MCCEKSPSLWTLNKNTYILLQSKELRRHDDNSCTMHGMPSVRYLSDGALQVQNVVLYAPQSIPLLYTLYCVSLRRFESLPRQVSVERIYCFFFYSNTFHAIIFQSVYVERFELQILKCPTDHFIPYTFPFVHKVSMLTTISFSLHSQNLSSIQWWWKIKYI